MKEIQFILTSPEAYTRYEYPASGIQSKVYSTIIDTNNNNTGDAADEVLSESFTDGAGRVRMSRTPHTFDAGGGTLTWAASLTEYDSLGRVKRQSVPTEVDSSWTPTDDDATRGFLWTYQKYDWKGRIIRKINTDGTDQEAWNDSDVLISYQGCGCAGGQVAVIEAERVPVPGTILFARRKKKVYEDILGRTYKTETFEWDGYTVYSTAVTRFNGRDQAALIREYAGSDSSSTYQDKTAAYDGHGRMASTHRPEERDSSNNPAYTTYTYNADDTAATMTDGRGVVTSYTYENVGGVPKRQLLTKTEWDVGSTGVSDTPDVTVSYDGAGNRATMTDALGTVNYAYNSLSQMMSEAREFAGLSNQSFALSYTYQLGGQLKTLTDPTSKVVSYGEYKSGRLKTVTGGGFDLSVPFVSDIKYRAWGAVKRMTYGNGVLTSLEYNSRLLPSSYQLTNFNSANWNLGGTYTYHNDGALKSVEDLGSDTFDRSYTYDHVGRIASAFTGAEAHGGTTADGPYAQTYHYDVWGNTTSLNHREWTGSAVTDSMSTSNNRRSAFSYNALGQVTQATDGYHTYDAMAARTHFDYWDYEIINGNPQPYYQATTTYTGDKVPARQVTTTIIGSSTTFTDTRYYVTSSVLGGKPVTVLDGSGNWVLTNIYAEGVKVADYGPSPGPGYPDRLGWFHTDPVTGNQAWSGRVAETGGATQLDPLGNDVTSPPEPELLPDPHYIDLNNETFWVIEGPGPSEYFLEAMADWEERIGNTRDMYRAEYFWAHGHRDRAIDIISQNPNVGIEYWSVGLRLERPSGTIFGEQAAAFLTAIDQAIQSGELVAANGRLQDRYIVPGTRKEFRSVVQEFFRASGRDLRRCVWSVFSTDRDGNRANTAQVMETPSSRVFPYDRVTLYERIVGAQGFHRGSTGEIGLKTVYSATTMFGGQVISAREAFFRTLAHEYGNYLSWKYTGDAETFGTREGIPGDATPGAGLRSASVDYDTGSRLEKCIWGSTAY